ALAEVRETESQLERELAASAPLLARSQETWYHLSGLRERIRGTAGLAAERIRLATSETEEPTPGRDPEQLEMEAAQAREAERQIQAEVAERQTALEAAVQARREAEDRHAEEERRVAGLVRAAADRREGLARLAGQVNAMRSRIQSVDDEIGRLQSARAEVEERAKRAEHDFTALETQVASLDAGESGLDAEYEGAQAVLDDLTERLAKRRDEAQAAERERAALAARVEALELGLTRKDGA